MSAKKKVLSGLIIVSWLSIMLFAVTAFAAPALNLKSASVAINGKVALKVTNAVKVTSWFTDDPTVASVDQNGVVTGIGYGYANIYVRADGQALSARINVKDPYPGKSCPAPYSGYKKLTKNAHGTVADVFAIAKSQNGYAGSSSRPAYFGTKWNTYATNLRDRDWPGAWCSDFVSWLMVAARVPGSTGLFDVKNGYRPDLTILGHYRDSLYVYQPAYRAHKSGIDGFLRGYKIQGILTPQTIRQGDIAITHQGHHTTIVLEVAANGDIKVIEGNYFDKVHIGGRFRADEIYAVARPSYTAPYNGGQPEVIRTTGTVKKFGAKKTLTAKNIKKALK